MTYIHKAIKFLHDELEAAKREVWRLKNLPDNAHGDEGDTISGAVAKKYGKNNNSTIFSFPNQFTKIKDDQKVILWDGTTEEDEIEVVEIDYLKNTIELTGNYPLGEKFLIIAAKVVSPRNIINSLKKADEDDTSLIIRKLVNRSSKLTVYDQPTIENMTKTIDLMNSDALILQGPAGTGKSFNLSKIINHLLDQPSEFSGETKRIAVCANSHHAINNLLNELKHPKLKGLKIGSQEKHKCENKQIKNVYVSGKDIDSQIAGYNLVGATAFALAKINNYMFDFLIVDEGSQIKFSYLLSLARIAKNVIVAGDQKQLQSISILPDAEGGESVLDYMLGKNCNAVPKSMGYFLNKTYRCEEKVAKVMSEVFYDGKLDWHKKGSKGVFKLLKVNHNSGQKNSKEEALAVVKLYKELIKKKVKPQDILIVSPYNAQNELIKSMIHTKNKNYKKTKINTADSAQGATVPIVIFCATSSGSKAIPAEFATNPNRVNVCISRSSKDCYIIASESLIKSEYSSPEFKKVIKMIEN